MRLMDFLPWGQKKKNRKPARGRVVTRRVPVRKTRGRKRPTPDWARRRRVVAASLLLIALSGTAWLWHSGWVERRIASIGEGLLNATAQAGLKIGDVLVEGRVRTTRSAILETLGVARGTPILALDPHAAKARLEALPWVLTATVERRLPRIVHIQLTERQPLALWQFEGRLTVIDQAGAVIDQAQSKAFASLPLLVGEGAPIHAADLLDMLKSEPELNAKVTAAVRVRDRRWNVRLAGDIDVRLPEIKAAEAWAELARIQREHSVLSRDVVIIDLRMPDRLVVRTSPDAAPKGGGTGEDT